MAQPTLVRRARAQGPSSNSTTFTPSWSYTSGLNTAISSGEDVMWVCIVASDGSPTLSINAGASDSGWSLDGQTSQGSVVGAVLTCNTTVAFASSSQPALQVDSTASEQYTAILFAYKAGTGKVMRRILSSGASGSSANADPPSVTQNSGATQDVTALAMGAWDSTITPSGAPSTYGNLTAQGAAGAGGAGSATSDRQITALANGGTENPGTFTSSTEQWVTYTALVYEIDPPVATPRSYGFII